jgi:outer membrane receptor for ferrienterochelin and colicin
MAVANTERYRLTNNPNIMKNFALTISIVLTSYLCFGQITGKVTNSDNEPLIAVIYFSNSQLGTISNADGYFSIGIPTRSNWLICTATGYFKDSIYVESKKQELNLLFKLNTDNTLGTVEINDHDGGTHISGIDPQTFQILNEKELCKAACCSLSESFETNGSVDASFTDGITGTRQIKMMGLDGKFTQILFDNMPAVWGLSSVYGLSYLPGPWINSIAIAKGTGAVMHGYEGVSGQINVSHKGATMKEKLFVNTYASSASRLESNVLWNNAINEHTTMQVQTHVAQAQHVFDTNADGFIDNPLFRNGLARVALQYSGEKGLNGEYAVSIGSYSSKSGQAKSFQENVPAGFLWTSGTLSEHMEFTGKTGFVFDEHGHTSIGSQITLGKTDVSSQFGYRDYLGNQNYARINLLFSHEIIEETSITAGVSGQIDDYEESLQNIGGTTILNANRTEQSFGAFTELNSTIKERLQIILGLRADKNNIYGNILTPRGHMRFSITENMNVKLSAGKAYRSPQIIMDNLSALAGNRVWNVTNLGISYPFALNMEEANTFGLAFVNNMRWFHRNATWSVDAFYSNFKNQIVADYETRGEFYLYNLDGKSFSKAIQTDLTFSPLKRTEFRLAYRWLDTKTTYRGTLKERPLVAQNRFFMNASYSTKENAKGRKLNFDFTARWLGQQRLAILHHTAGMEEVEYSPSYWTLNTQIAFFIQSNLEIYVGGENLTGYMAHHPIYLFENVESQYFDASQVYGPMFGANYYVGLRWRIGENKE